MTSLQVSFDDAMYEVLQHRNYDILTGRRVDIGREVDEWITQRIFDALLWVFRRVDLGNLFPETTDGFSTIATVFAVVGIIMILVAVFVIIRALMLRKWRKDYDLSDIFEELAQGNYSVADLLQISQNADDRRISIRYRYIAVLLSLNEREIIHISQSATNGLILQEINSKVPILVQPFRSVAEVFHQSWFGYKDIPDEKFTQFIDDANKLIAEVGFAH